jgi:transcriptional regulator with XRE-family HTH domain
MPESFESLETRLHDLGGFIRDQRRNARLSLRKLSEQAGISNPYLSQIERGLHEPSVRVLKAIATALNVSAESLLTQAGLLEDEATAISGGQTAAIIERDSRLKPEQRTALLAVYQSYLEANEAEAAESPTAASAPEASASRPDADAKKPRTKARGSSKKKT